MFVWKRTFDIAVASVGLIISVPIILMAGLLVKCESRGPMIFRQVRTGKDGNPFTLYKIRTMYVDPNAYERPDRNKDDVRTLRIGAYLRKTKIDELPQFWNVLIGDMSIVGPRPTVIEDTEKYNDRERRRLSVRPGLTGLAQVNGGVLITWPERIEYDLYYVDHPSIRMEIYILWRTLVIGFTGNRRNVHRLRHLIDYRTLDSRSNVEEVQRG